MINVMSPAENTNAKGKPQRKITPSRRYTEKQLPNSKTGPKLKVKKERWDKQTVSTVKSRRKSQGKTIINEVPMASKDLQGSMFKLVP